MVKIEDYTSEVKSILEVEGYAWNSARNFESLKHETLNTLKFKLRSEKHKTVYDVVVWFLERFRGLIGDSTKDFTFLPAATRTWVETLGLPLYLWYEPDGEGSDHGYWHLESNFTTREA